METAQDFAQQNGMMFTEISAKEGKKIQMVLRMLRSKLATDQRDQFFNRVNLNQVMQNSKIQNRSPLGDTLEITNQSLLKNLQEATLTRSQAEVGDTPQFDQFTRRKSNNAIIDELRDAIESYEETDSQLSDDINRMKIISPLPNLMGWKSAAGSAE